MRNVYFGVNVSEIRGHDWWSLLSGSWLGSERTIVVTDVKAQLLYSQRRVEETSEKSLWCHTFLKDTLQ